MKGIDEAREAYFSLGKPMIESEFPEYSFRIAAGLVGHGSECFGYDDEISRDHDFEKGFCLFITDEDDLKIGPKLSRAYSELFPKTLSSKSAMGEKKLGVIRISDFYRRYTGSSGAPDSWQQWLSIPSYALCEATNGGVFEDNYGMFSSIREKILHEMPEDVRKKKMAARAVEMAQSGQYNYARCLSHGEEAAASLALFRFIESTCQMIYLLNRAHAPYYKWIFRSMEKLSRLSDMKEALEFLSVEKSDIKMDIIEDICHNVILELTLQGLSDSCSDYMEDHAFEIMERIESQEIRSLHVMEG